MIPFKDLSVGRPFNKNPIATKKKKKKNFLYFGLFCSQKPFVFGPFLISALGHSVAKDKNAEEGPPATRLSSGVSGASREMKPRFCIGRASLSGSCLGVLGIRSLGETGKKCRGIKGYGRVCAYLHMVFTCLYLISSEWLQWNNSESNSETNAAQQKEAPWKNKRTLKPYRQNPCSTWENPLQHPKKYHLKNKSE